MKRLLSLPCIFNLITGYYCPGCGGTRAVKFLLSGHPVKSFIYHPIVIYTLLAVLYTGIKKLINKKYHPNIIFVWMALLVIIINFIIKNLALYYGLDLLAI